MKTIELITQYLNIDTDQIDALLDKFGITLERNEMKMMLDNCIYNRDFNMLKEHIALHIFETVKEAYKDQLEPEKFGYSFDNQLFVLKYDGEEIVGKMHLDRISKEIKEEKEWIEKRNATREFHLLEEDKTILLGGGCKQDELDIIEWEANVCRYSLENQTRKLRDITRDEAIKLLGHKNWLWSIERTAFHWSSSRECLKNKNHVIYFRSGLPGRYD